MAATEPKAPFREFAPAKINLFLHVLGKRADGYHELDSLVAFADVGDHLTVRPAGEWGLTIAGPCAEDLNDENPANNLVLKAARLAAEWAKGAGATLTPLHFTLEKHLPVASGIGGGSADAAAALRICAKAARLPIDDHLRARALELGADVPVCLESRPAWMSGMGELLEPAQLPEGLGVVLVNSGVQVSTREVFARLSEQGVSEAARAPRDVSTMAKLTNVLGNAGNDLEDPAAIMELSIRDTIRAIEETNPIVSGMSGSGATCFGIYVSTEAASKAATALRTAHHNWWIAEGELLGA